MNNKGEGSRGGVVIGHTRSGKPIYESGNKKPGFNNKDHLDAALAHAKKKAQAWQALKNMNEKTEIAQKYRKKFNEHEKQEKFHTEETKNIKKGNMNSIDQEMDQVAENMEKSNKSEIELLIETIKTQGPEKIKKALPHLDEMQLTVLKKALEALNKAKATPMDADYVAPRKDVDIHTRKVEEEFKDDDADEKLVKEKNKKIDHQGDSTPEGKDSNDVPVKKAEEEDSTDNIAEKDEKISKSDTLEPKKPVKEEKIEKSVNWTPRNLLSVGQGERTFHVSVNDFYAEAIKKSEEVAATENQEEKVEKSDSKEKLSIDEMIKKGLDQSKEDLEREEIKKSDKARSYSPTNFSIDDMIKLMNLKKDEAADILKD